MCEEETVRDASEHLGLMHFRPVFIAIAVGIEITNHAFNVFP